MSEATPEATPTLVQTQSTQPTPSQPQQSVATQNQPLTVEKYVVASEKNYPRRRTMEDAHFIMDPLVELNGHIYSLYCIFDGHGGRTASQHAAKIVGGMVTEILKRDIAIEEKIEDIYAELNLSIKDNKIDYPGSCALMCIIDKFGDKRTIYMSNAGDSMGYILSTSGVTCMSEEHNTKNSEEITRLQNSGALIMSGRVNGVIAVTRALGDHYIKQWIVSAPYMKAAEVTSDMKYIVLACDGLWDGINAEKVKEVLETEGVQFEAVAKQLTQLAISKGSTDNITVIVIKL
uniref:Protein phosphatase 2C, putative n=1 Tax=Entamoeba invadens TaxID=33085 RepID=S0B3P2_ENTIV|nr:protein phosphatase 2C, putative [Entamoeba invadens]